MSGRRATEHPCANGCGRMVRRTPYQLRRYGFQVCGKACLDEYNHKRAAARPVRQRSRWIRGGYVYVYVGPRHHLADSKGYAPEHYLITEDILGRRLRANERVRRLASGDRQDNRPAVLFIEWIDQQSGEARAANVLAVARAEAGEG